LRVALEEEVDDARLDALDQAACRFIDAAGASAAQGFTVAVNGPGFSISTASPLPGTAVGDPYGVVQKQGRGIGLLLA